MSDPSVENYENATHLLSCRHAVGPNGRDYFMRCNVVKIMPDGRLKIQLFGERYWTDRTDKVSIRYVEAERVSEIKK